MKTLSYGDRAQFARNPLAKKIFLLMHEKKSNLALSADVTSCDTLLTLIKQCGSDICVLKTHVDILDDFTQEFSETLTTLAKQYQFFIFEDRKFADIGNTVKQQYQHGIYHIADWADMINAHSLPGPGIVSALSEIGLPRQKGLLLLAEMSSKNNFITTEYTQKTIQMAEQFPEFVIGFIAQRKLAFSPGWLYLTPGVQFSEKTDALGQQYITPEKALFQNETDIIIVGRGIIHSDDPAASAKQYREAGWRAYAKRL